MMDILHALLIVVEALCSILLIVVILIQRTRGQGMGIMLGAGAVESVFGAQMGNFLTKTTVILGIIFLVNTTLLAMLGAGGGSQSVADKVPAQSAPVTGSGVPPAEGPAAGPSGRAPITVPAGDAAPVGAPEAAAPAEAPAAPAADAATPAPAPAQ